MADLYDDGAGTDNPGTASEKSDDEGSNTALLPKDFFPSGKPLEPGNTCKVRVEKVLDDQVLVAYEKSDESKDTEEVEEAEVESPMDEMMA